MDAKFMKTALREAQKAASVLEVPVGAVVVRDGKIVARAHNKRETSNVATAHAELLAVEKACKKLGVWRLLDCDLYVTLEPCPMCMGAVISARVKRLFFGASDPKAGACGSVLDLTAYPLNHKVEVYGGVMEQQCSDILTEFFQELRKRKGATS